MNRYSATFILLLLYVTVETISGKSLILKRDFRETSAVEYSECTFSIDEPCRSEGENYSDLNKWHTNNCLECTCYEGIGVMCCNKLRYPIDWPAHCMPVLRKNECKINLVEKRNPNEECDQTKSWLSNVE